MSKKIPAGARRPESNPAADPLEALLSRQSRQFRLSYADGKSFAHRGGWVFFLRLKEFIFALFGSLVFPPFFPRFLSGLLSGGVSTPSVHGIYICTCLTYSDDIV
jgi:hypothetical protein